MKVPRTGRAQIAFLLVLLVAVAQVVWWIYDQARYSRERQQELLAAYEAERATAEELFAANAGYGELVTQLDERFPHLEMVDGGVRIRPDALQALERERRSHVNQYRWEGAFFLVVLLAGVWVIRRALLQERELRLRQENFLAAVSHELKSPIASLRLAGDTLQRPQLDGERRAQLLARNQRDLDRLEDLVTKLLDTSRLEARGVEVVPEDVELRPLLLEITGDLEPGVRAGRGAADSGSAAPWLVLEVPEGLTIRADPAALETVLRNLLANAFAAVNEAERAEVSVKAWREEAPRGGSAHHIVEVRDNGVGFAPSEAQRLFEKFYRPGSELRRNTRGTGLGLYLVKRLVELEGGTVSAASEGPGRGAVFRASWPAR